MFREACDRKENKDDIHSAENGARACSLLGGLYLAGDGVDKDLVKGRELSQLGCQRGDSFGCFNSAVVFAGGQGVEKNAAKAAEYYDLACKAGDGEACHELAAAYGKGDGVAKDVKLSKSLDQKACELGFEAACPKKGKKKP
jgi:TPR repeat protein